MNIAVLASHEGTTLQAILDACSGGALHAQVGIAISNNADSGALRRAKGPVILLLHDKNVLGVRALARILDFVDGENARATREGSKPIRLVDYRVLLPAPELPETGLEPWARVTLHSLGALADLAAFR